MFLSELHRLIVIWVNFVTPLLSSLSVTGVLEADFVEPTHDKQGFERTAVLARLENKLVKIQKDYWFVLFVNAA